MYAQTLHCPNCSASVSSDKSKCEFCGARLKTVICPHCGLMMFAGSTFCNKCGAVLPPVDFEPEGKGGDCPRCGSALQWMHFEQTHLRTCGKCDGLWMAPAEFEQMCADAERSSVVLGFFRERPSNPSTATKIAYVPCPDCGQLMNRSNFARASGVIVDVCKPHGIWFDADELPAIIEFVQKGGMEIARQRQLQDIRAERERLESVDQFAATIAMDSPVEQDDRVSIRSFVKSLFD